MPRENRPRRRKAGTRVQNLIGDDPHRRRWVAIEYARDFLVAAIAQERLLLAQSGREPSERHTENVLGNELAHLPGTKTLQNDPVRALQALAGVIPLSALREEGHVDIVRSKAIAELDDRVDLFAKSIERAIPKEWSDEREQIRFEGAHRGLSNWLRLPAALNDRARWTKIERARTELAEAEAALDALMGGDPTWQAAAKSVAEKQAAVDALDPRIPVYSSETQVRAALEKELGLSRVTVIKRAKRIPTKHRK